MAAVYANSITATIVFSLLSK